jgi:hypothetical protein
MFRESVLALRVLIPSPCTKERAAGIALVDPSARRIYLVLESDSSGSVCKNTCNISIVMTKWMPFRHIRKASKTYVGQCRSP